MKQTKNPNTQFEIQIGEKGKSWKTNLWIVAHGGSDLFPSSGELFFFEIVLLRCVVWWRFGRELFLPRNHSAPATCVAVVEVRREGRGEGVSFGWVSFFVLFGVCCLERAFRCEVSIFHVTICKTLVLESLWEPGRELKLKKWRGEEVWRWSHEPFYMRVWSENRTDSY